MSVSYKFVLAILSVVFFIIALFTYSNIEEQKKLLNIELEKRVKLMKDNLIQDATHTITYYKSEVENDLASMNLSHIHTLFKQLVEREEIDGISLSNNPQTVEIVIGDSPMRDVGTLTIEENNTSVIVSSPIELSSKWGNLNIVYSLKKLNSEIRSAQKGLKKVVETNIKKAFVSTVLISLFFGIISYILAIKITKPILILTSRADQIANGKLDGDTECLNIESNDEVGQLAKTFVLMSQKLSKSYAELKTLNETLEKKVEERTKELKLLAVTDPMTQLYNRRHFTSIANDVLSIVKRKKEDLSIIMIDIDKFKNINDAYGHKIGDDAIIEFANILKSTQRESDVSCRFGGEEFVVLLPETDVQGAVIVAQSLREKIENHSIILDQDKSLKFTISLGVSNVDLAKESDIILALQRADNALYEAKRSGRNCVRVK